MGERRVVGVEQKRRGGDRVSNMAQWPPGKDKLTGGKFYKQEQLWVLSANLYFLLLCPCPTQVFSKIFFSPSQVTREIKTEYKVLGTVFHGCVGTEWRAENDLKRQSMREMQASAEAGTGTSTYQESFKSLDFPQLLGAILGFPAIYGKGAGATFTEQLKQAERFQATQVAEDGVMLIAPWNSGEWPSYNGEHCSCSCVLIFQWQCALWRVTGREDLTALVGNVSCLEFELRLLK